jgi:DNA-binding MarR family transcriptional regulator
MAAGRFATVAEARAFLAGWQRYQDVSTVFIRLIASGRPKRPFQPFIPGSKVREFWTPEELDGLFLSACREAGMPPQDALPFRAISRAELAEALAEARDMDGSNGMADPMQDHAWLSEALHAAVADVVRRDAPDLSSRQLAVLLVCHLDEPPHTIRGLASRLHISWPAAMRAIERLEQLGLVRRAGLKPYRRGTPAEGTEAGRAFVQQLGATMLAATSSTTSAPSPLR